MKAHACLKINFYVFASTNYPKLHFTKTDPRATKMKTWIANRMLNELFDEANLALIWILQESCEPMQQTSGKLLPSSRGNSPGYYPYFIKSTFILYKHRTPFRWQGLRFFNMLGESYSGLYQWVNYLKWPGFNDYYSTETESKVS